MKTTSRNSNTKKLSARDMRRKLGFQARRAGFRHIPADHVWERLPRGMRLTIGDQTFEI